MKPLNEGRRGQNWTPIICCVTDPQQSQTPHLSLCQGLQVSPSPRLSVHPPASPPKAQFHPSCILPSFRAGLGSPEEFLQPWQGTGAAALEHMQLRPCSKPNSLIKNVWPQDSAAFWQPGREKMVIQQLLHSCALV